MAEDHDREKPTVLYKYLPTKIALKALPEGGGNGTLRATQPEALNDPLECATRSKAIYATSKSEWTEMVRVLNSITPRKPLSAEDVEYLQQQLGSQAWNELFRRQLSQRFGVVSFSKLFNHPLLWAHYAESGAGVVIGYNVSELQKIATGNQRLDAVNYSSDPPFILAHRIFKDEKNLHAALLTKATYWKFEKEWRLTLELGNTSGTGDYDQRKYPINVCTIPNKAVKEVYITERTPNDVVTKINNSLWSNNQYGTFKPELLVLSLDEYGYEKSELDLSATKSY